MRKVGSDVELLVFSFDGIVCFCFFCRNFFEDLKG